MRSNGIQGYDELVKRSQDDVEWFWDAVVKDLSIEFYRPYSKVMDSSNGIPWTTWFGGGTVNLAHNCVDRWAERTPDKVAVLWESEDGVVRRVTYAELREMADRLANGLRSLGVRDGDTVGIFLPMAPETVAATLACAKIGAVYVPIFSGYGAPAVASRLQDAEAKVLITADGFIRRGGVIPMKETADQAVADSPSVAHVVVWERLGRDDLPWTDGRDVRWSELLAAQPQTFDTLHLDPEHPLLIAYTSGTTGLPKGSVHVHGGFLVKIAEEAAYQADIHADDILFWVSDLGWIMGPWEIVGAGAAGATVFLFDGAPNDPPDRLWDLVERHRITALGISPTLIRALIPAGDEMVERHDLSSLRILGSTGEPWNPDPYLWFLHKVGGGRCPIINISGGTEVGACFLSPLPITSLKATTLRGPALGMDIDVWGPDGAPVARGEVGELVCKKPWPAMTRGVWKDPQRYLDAYWNRWPDVWVHGDWATIDDDGFWFLHGRSDDTMNIAGKRLGPAEVESALAGNPAVAESAAVGVHDEVKGEAVWCFVVTKPGYERTDSLAADLKRAVTDSLGKSFRPSQVLFVDELPKTRSAKIVRRALRALVMDADAGDLSSLENPASLDGIRSALPQPVEKT
ncbi:MAG TPA: AMP-dependent synthetase [Actinobacteria bacterium]|nr:AMP-dependent synthetase [Actinomycetota bacterium]